MKSILQMLDGTSMLMLSLFQVTNMYGKLRGLTEGEENHDLPTPYPESMEIKIFLE